MNNKIIGRDNNRVPLHMVVPRTVPFAIGIAASDICNFRCIYCNQSTEKGIEAARILPWDDFIEIVNQLEKLTVNTSERIKIIRFIGNGEPLVNKDIAKMIKYVSEKKLADRYEVTTNGSLLTHELTDELLRSGLTRLLVSIQGVTREKYNKICGYNMNMDNLLDELTYFYEKSRNTKCSIAIKTVNVSLDTKEEEKKFYEMFSPIADTICIENIIASSEGVDFDDMLSEEERKMTRYNTPVANKICCETLFMYMNIHSNGDVDSCGCIYPPLFIGNVYENEIADIWNGKKHKEFMLKHLLKRRNEIEVCAKCQSINHYSTFEEDNLDKYLDEVLKKVEAL